MTHIYIYIAGINLGYPMNLALVFHMRCDGLHIYIYIYNHQTTPKSVQNRIDPPFCTHKTVISSPKKVTVTCFLIFFVTKGSG